MPARAVVVAVAAGGIGGQRCSDVNSCARTSRPRTAPVASLRPWSSQVCLSIFLAAFVSGKEVQAKERKATAKSHSCSDGVSPLQPFPFSLAHSLLALSRS